MGRQLPLLHGGRPIAPLPTAAACGVRNLALVVNVYIGSAAMFDVNSQRRHVNNVAQHMGHPANTACNRHPS
jgi:hypothetical protein